MKRLSNTESSYSNWLAFFRKIRILAAQLDAEADPNAGNKSRAEVKS